MNTHLSNDWSGFELNPFPPSSVLPRTPSRFWPSFSASHPPLVRYHPTGDGEWERGRREREREMVEGRGRGRELRPNVSRLITPTTCLWPTSRVASTRIPSQKSDRKSAYLPHAYRDVISDFFIVGRKNSGIRSTAIFLSQEIYYRLHKDILIEMQTRNTKY